METDHTVAWLKVAIAWLGVFVGGIGLSQIALVLTIVFTALQIYKLVRGLHRERRLEKLEATLKHKDPA